MSQTVSQKTKNTRIYPLPSLLIDRIAAGEVIDSPSSVLKELVENSLDADSQSISIDTRKGGMESIMIQDDGIGIHSEDICASLTRYSTSKIQDLYDLEMLLSFGFRGEALAAIASVSQLEIQSRRATEENLSPSIGTKIISRGGTILQTQKIAHEKGTIITVNELFYSTPARRKYLKSERSENIKNYRELIRLALCSPQTSFFYSREGKEFSVWKRTIDEKGKLSSLESEQQLEGIKKRIGSIYGEKLQNSLLKVYSSYGGIECIGFISSPDYHKAVRDTQFSFVNHRPVEIKNLPFFVRKAYDELLPNGAYPCFFLFLHIEPSRVDVNVHPQKREVRLLDQSILHHLIVQGLSASLKQKEPFALNSLLSSDKFTANTYSTNRQNPRLEHKTEDRMIFPHTIMHHTYSSQTEQKRASELTTASSSKSKTDLEQPKPSFCFEHRFGTIFGTYVLAEGNGNLYIIDQHTAHERINYEQMLAKLSAEKGERQALLSPIVIDCLPDDLEKILEHQRDFWESGFSIEEAGPKAYKVREVPIYLNQGSIQEEVQKLIPRVLAGEKGICLYKDYAAMRACKASVKKNDQISWDLMGDILEMLVQCKEPMRCPHGRPTMVQISLQQLDRMFQR